MTYAEKLKHPKWQKKRLQVLNKYGFMCNMCWDDETELHVHHKSYLPNTDPWDYPITNFQVLCKNCHCIVEWAKQEGAEIITIASSGSELKFYKALVYNKNETYSLWVYNYSKELNFLSGIPISHIEELLPYMKKHKNKHGKNKINQTGVL